MTLIHPLALLLLLLAVPIVWLYRRDRTPVHQVSTVFPWAKVFQASPRRAAWQPYRRRVSLALSLTILALVAIGLAEPMVGRPRRVVLVINSSAMNSPLKPNWTEHATLVAQLQIDALGYRDQAMIISAGETVDICRRFTATGDASSRAALATAVAGVQATSGPSCVMDAVAIARSALGGDPNGTIVVFTEGCFDGSSALAKASDVELIAVGNTDYGAALRPTWPPIWPWPLGTAAVLATAQWCLFQRRWTC